MPSASFEMNKEVEYVRGVLGELRLIVGEMRGKGDAFELDSGVRERLAAWASRMSRSTWSWASPGVSPTVRPTNRERHIGRRLSQK